MDEKLQEVLTEIRDKVIRIETKIEGYNGLREKLDKAYGMACNTDKRVDKIEDNTKWLWRTFAGALIIAFVAAFIKWGA